MSVKMHHNVHRYAQLPIHGRSLVVLPDSWLSEHTLATPLPGNCV